jgi:peptide subunit release factor 1 (eRF1)
MDKLEKDDQSIEIFRMKRLFKRLETAKVSGSVITIVIPPRKNVS